MGVACNNIIEIYCFLAFNKSPKTDHGDDDDTGQSDLYFISLFAALYSRAGRQGIYYIYVGM